jgi:hypothetical protein
MHSSFHDGTWTASGDHCFPGAVFLGPKQKLAEGGRSSWKRR